jgi:hypothetical protein
MCDTAQPFIWIPWMTGGVEHHLCASWLFVYHIGDTAIWFLLFTFVISSWS